MRLVELLRQIRVCQFLPLLKVIYCCIFTKRTFMLHEEHGLLSLQIYVTLFYKNSLLYIASGE